MARTHQGKGRSTGNHRVITKTERRNDLQADILRLSVPLKTLSAQHRSRVLPYNNLGEPYCEPCSQCGQKLSATRVRAGFSNGLYDIRTTCPKCKRRFVAIGTMEQDDDISFQFPLLCEDQTKDQFQHFLSCNPKTKDMSDKEIIDLIVKERPDLAWNSHWHGERRFPEESVSNVVQSFLLGTMEKSESESESESEESESESEEKPVPIKTTKKVVPQINPTVGKTAIKKITKSAGINRVSKKATPFIQDVTSTFLEDLIGKSTLLMQHRKAKTLTKEDAELVMRLSKWK